MLHGVVGVFVGGLIVGGLICGASSGLGFGGSTPNSAEPVLVGDAAPPLPDPEP